MFFKSAKTAELTQPRAQCFWVAHAQCRPTMFGCKNILLMRKRNNAFLLFAIDLA